MTKIKCTGLKCPMQVGKVDPATCKAAGTCAWTTKPMTNSDRIRAMSNEELSFFLSCIIHEWFAGTAEICGKWNVVIDNWLDWLKQEVKE